MTRMADEVAYQLINTLSGNSSNQGLSGSYTNIIHEVWYLFGYPTLAIQNADVVVTTSAAAAGGSTQSVTIKTAQRFTNAPLIQQGGFWVLAKLPTITTTSGQPVLDTKLVADGFNRLIYDLNTNGAVFIGFNSTARLQIFDSTGKLIFDGSPLVGPISLVPPANPNTYTAQGMHFDGATGLVTANPLFTLNTATISFSGWFNPDPSLSGQLEFSQGSGSNTTVIDTSPPASWFHMMGTIDVANNFAALVVNALPVGTLNTVGTVPLSIPTNGTSLYIGTDNQGNFYKGDIADLAIWFDFSFIQNGAIQGTTISSCVDVRTDVDLGSTTITPRNPDLNIFGFSVLKKPVGIDVEITDLPSLSGNVLKFNKPNIFLSGPAASALTPHTSTGVPVQGVSTLNVVSGTLTNSSTNPSAIVLVPT